MAQFKGILTGQQGKAVRLGSKQSGLVAEVKGWDAGVVVEALFDEKEGCDLFRIYETNGAAHAQKYRMLARVFGKRSVKKP